MPWDFWLIFFVLGALIPWRGRARLRRLLAAAAIGTKERLALYGSTIAFQWILVAVVAWRAFARGVTASQMALAHPVTLKLVFLSLVGGAVLGAFQWFNLRRVSRMKGPVPELMHKLAERLLPSKPVEFGPYCGLAVTAGVCEEFLYRGFAMAALSRAGITEWAVVLISSVLFGFAHAYQGRSGIAATTLMGLIFAGSRLIFHSLGPAIVWHTAVDLAAGIAGPRYLLKGRVEPGPDSQQAILFQILTGYLLLW